MAKRKKASRSRSKKGGWYQVETYGIKYDSVTFLLFLAFVAVVSMLLLAQMAGVKLY